MLLASVLFLTGIWHEADHHRRAWRSSRPAMGRHHGGPRRTTGQPLRPRTGGAVGALLFALGRRLVGHAPDRRTPLRAADFLPGMMIGGVGVGLMIPSLTGAVASTLAPARLATGIAVQTTGRQIGSALGFAILVAVLGTPHTAGDFKGGLGVHDRREPAGRGDADRDRRARAGERPNPVRARQCG